MFPRVSDQWLTILRIGLGLQIVFYSLSLAADWNNLFQSGGGEFIDRNLEEAILNSDSPTIPRLGWLIAAGHSLGMSEKTVIGDVWIVLLCAGGLLCVGLFSRVAAVTAWFLHVCVVKSAALMSYGVDTFTTIGLFYLMLSPLPDRFTVDRLISLGNAKNRCTIGFCHRMLQLHVCFIYFFSGLAKSIGAGWWNGLSLWRSLVSPPFDVLSLKLVLSVKYLLPAIGISICLLELGYPFLIWPKKTRFVCLTAIVAMHIAIGVTMRLYLFAFIMIVLNLAAFAPEFLLAAPRRRNISRAARQLV